MCMEARSVADELAQRSTSEGDDGVTVGAHGGALFPRKPAPWGDGRQEAAMTQVSKRALPATLEQGACIV